MSGISVHSAGDGDGTQDDVMRSLGSTLVALQQSIVGLTAQLQEMKQTPRVATDEVDPSNHTFPWAETLEERYPVKDPATYTEFEKRYPPDRYGEEATDTARVWKLYRDRATELDQDKIDSWNKTLDILLIFAGLFSAVASAFLIESYQLLQQDYSQYLALAFFAAQTNTTVPNPADFVVPIAAVWTNGLWFTSLLLALTVALLAILVKQWLGEYSSRMRAHVASPRAWVWRHLTYSAGLEKWHVDTFLSTLPVLLHIALFLFFAGLAIFLWNVNLAIAIFIASGTALLTIFYAFSTAAPLVYGDCPSATPLLRQLHAGFNAVKRHARYALRPLASMPGLPQNTSNYFRRTLTAVRLTIYRHLPTIQDAAFEEVRLISTDTVQLDLNALCWMATNLPAENEVEVAVDCVGSLDIDLYLNPLRTDPVRLDLLRSSCGRYLSALSGRGVLVDDLAVARCLRATLFLDIQQNSPELRHFPADFNTAVLRWFAAKKYDLCFLVANFSNFRLIHEPPNVIHHALIEWTNSHRTSSAISPSTLRLLSILSIRWSPGLLTCVACALGGLSDGSPFQESMTRTLSKVLHKFKPELSRTPLDASSVGPRLDLSFSVLRRVLHYCNDTPHLLARELARNVFAEALGLAAQMQQLPRFDLQELEHAISFVGTWYFLRHEWSPQTLLNIGSLLSEAPARIPDRGPTVYWSAGLNNIWQNWLLQFSRDSGPELRKMSASVFLYIFHSAQTFKLKEDMSVESFLEDSLINILRRPSTAPEPGPRWRDRPMVSTGTRSTWRLSTERCIERNLAYHFGEMAKVLIKPLLSLHRRGVDVSALLQELLVDELVIEVLYSQQLTAMYLVRRGREISEDWWRAASHMLLEIPKDEWRFDGIHYRSPREFVTCVERAER